MPAPKTKGEASTFLGMCSYLAAHIVHSKNKSDTDEKPHDSKASNYQGVAATL